MIHADWILDNVLLCYRTPTYFITWSWSIARLDRAKHSRSHDPFRKNKQLDHIIIVIGE